VMGHSSLPSIADPGRWLLVVSSLLPNMGGRARDPLYDSTDVTRVTGTAAPEVKMNIAGVAARMPRGGTSFIRTGTQ
jgi:hypothetical protein